MPKLIKLKPNKLWISLTNACNIQCSHCLIEASSKFKNELSKKEVFQIIKEAVNLGVKRIAFTGGEPLLRPDILDIIRYTSSFKIRTYLETNGAILTTELIHKLKNCNLEVLNLSLDGPTPKIHDKFRDTKGLFKKVIKSIHEAVKIGLDVRVYCTVTTQNIDVVEEIPKLFVHLPQKLGVLTYAYFVPLGRGQPKLAVSSVKWKSFCKKLDILIKLYKDKVPIRYEPVFLTKKEFKKLEESLPYNISCLARERDWIYVSPKGDIYGCVLLVNTNITLGNIRNQKLADIWLKSKNWSFFNPTKSNSNYIPCYNGECRALAFQIKESKFMDNFKYNKLDKNLLPICPLVQYPQIEPWPYEYKIIKR